MTHSALRVARLPAVLALMVARTAAAQEPDSDVIVYLIRDDRALLESPRRDELVLERIVQPALRLSTLKANRFTTAAKCRGKLCTAEAIADAYFDYYPQAFPKTADEIARWIERNNTDKFIGDVVKAGTTIDLPCLPVSPRQDDAAANGVRLYEPCSQRYAIAKSAEILGNPVSARNAVTGLSDPRLLVDDTFTRMTLSQYRAAYGNEPAPRGHGKIVTARGDVQDPVNRLLTIELFAPLVEPVPRDCSMSPYRDAWLNRLQTIGPAAVGNAAATEPPLVILDWDFMTAGDPEKGHGRKVFAAATRMLECLGLPQLVPQKLELNPRMNEQGLVDIVTAACEAHPECDPAIADRFKNVCNRKEQNPQPFVQSEEEVEYLDARCWIRTHDPQGGLRQKVDQYVLRSIFEAQLRAGVWLNVSFGSLREEALGIHQAIETIDDTASMIFAAAGNGGTLRVSVFPQSVARNKRDRVVNVSFGDRDGTIKGSVSDNDNSGLTEVALLARGAEFGHSELTNVAGSSFSTPWVAAAAWVKRLVDQTQNTSIRAELIRASRAVKPDIAGKIASGGFFDPYLLLLGDRTRLVALDESSSDDVEMGDITYTVQMEDGGTSTRPVKFCGQGDVDYFIFTDPADGKNYLWKRDRLSGAVERHELLTITGTVRRAGHPSEPLTLKDFLAKYSEFTTRKECS